MNVLFRVRTITCFISLQASHFENPQEAVNDRIAEAASFLLRAQKKLEDSGYTVQTVRIATNPFGEWLSDDPEDKLKKLDIALTSNNITFCALGPATTIEEIPLCVTIVKASDKFSCSADLPQNNAVMALECAKTIRKIGDIQNGLGPFRFCVASKCRSFIPFFPVARGDGGAHHKFAIGLENGALANKLLSDCSTIARIPTVFSIGNGEGSQSVEYSV